MTSFDNFTNSINQMREWLNDFDESTIAQNELQYFARSNRRKEAARLYQEYAHKVAVTSSYASYKDQIQNLNEENQELLIKLMSSAIDIISKNPSDFMDKTQNNKTIGIDSLIKNFKELPQELKDIIIDKFKSSAK
ncbi:hypothetical protein [Campylobacter devanensis]|uniref:hypothetical protein n=1 Tax=Campylobacter devanensis TaxID=3161138 RepID=UPI000A32B28A|nr:hypothetical protein [Campylobacter sp. P031]